MRAVYVLGAMDDAADNLEGDRMHSNTLREARVAVAELIEATKALSDSVTFRIDDPRCELHCKVVDALARVTGAPK